MKTIKTTINAMDADSFMDHLHTPEAKAALQLEFVRPIINKIMRVPYVEGGRWDDGAMPLGGLDCWGIVVAIRKAVGLWTPDPWGCGPKPASENPDGLPAEFTQHIRELDKPEAWCGVQMRSPWAGGHAGVFLPGGRVLHIPRTGVLNEPFTRLIRRRRVLGLFTFEESPE